MRQLTEFKLHTSSCHVWPYIVGAIRHRLQHVRGIQILLADIQWCHTETERQSALCVYMRVWSDHKELSAGSF